MPRGSALNGGSGRIVRVQIKVWASAALSLADRPTHCHLPIANLCRTTPPTFFGCTGFQANGRGYVCPLLCTDHGGSENGLRTPCVRPSHSFWYPLTKPPLSYVGKCIFMTVVVTSVFQVRFGMKHQQSPVTIKRSRCNITAVLN